MTADNLLRMVQAELADAAAPNLLQASLDFSCFARAFFCFLVCASKCPLAVYRYVYTAGFVFDASHAGAARRTGRAGAWSF